VSTVSEFAINLVRACHVHAVHAMHQTFNRQCQPETLLLMNFRSWAE